MEKRVLTVLRSGGEYGPQHVQAMQRQVRKWASADTEFFCLSDVPVPGVRNRVPLKYDWPGWWAKMELFRWDMPEDFLYTDLDNVILGPVDDLLTKQTFTADIGFSFFRVVPGAIPEDVYGRFWDNPAEHMGEWNPAARQDGKFGDAAYLRHRCNLDPDAWDPTQVMNVVDMPFDGGRISCPWHPVARVVPDGVRVMLCGGGRRRPWLSLSNAIQRAYWCREKS